jgi:hypothetical protein
MPKYALCDTSTGTIEKTISCSSRTAAVQSLSPTQVLIEVEATVMDNTHHYANGEVVPN